MDTKNNILTEEENFPMLFASYEKHDTNLCFYMDDNKDSHDGNHAVLYPEKISDLEETLEEIKSFYFARQITPRIYHPFIDHYFKNNEAILNNHGFKIIMEEDHRFMTLNAENTIPKSNHLDIRVYTSWQDCVANDILIPSEEPWEIPVTKRMLEKDETYLFIGYVDGKACVYSNIHRSCLKNTRFDYIVTAKECRGKGYASELISYIVEYCKRNGFYNCFQYAGPSEHICIKAGFRNIFTTPGGVACYEN